MRFLSKKNDSLYDTILKIPFRRLKIEYKNTTSYIGENVSLPERNKRFQINVVFTPDYYQFR